MEKIYRNQKIITEVEGVANKILEEKGRNQYRDRFFPELCKRMGYSIGAEIGVDKGGFSHHLLSRGEMDMLYCVDPWIDDFGSGHQKGYFDPNGTNRMDECAAHLKEFVELKKVELVKATGLEASVEIPDGYLDYVYLDGDHSLEGIFYDIYAWAPKVRTGGVISGHDYKNGPKSGMKDYWGGHLDYSVKRVVDYYCARYGYKLNQVGGRILSWWFVKA
jgi:hypothetical protein